MTQEQRELLLKDLCARLSYGVKAQIPDEYGGYTSAIESIDIDGFVVDFEGVQTEIEYIKPYLFPLSSMTEEQKEKALSLLRNCDYYLIDGVIKWLDNCPIEFFDWCNKHHFDYRGLIERGSANDATGKNIY